LLASALDDVLAGRRHPEDALASYQQQRDEAAIPMYELTLQMASGQLGPPAAASA
jgi:hypothetical protein